MPKIQKKIPKIFCGDVPPNNVVAQFGSLKAGSPAYSSDPSVIQSLPAWGGGWSGAVVANSAPALQDLNSLFYVITRQLAYFNQSGIPEWDAGETYYIGSVVQLNSIIYISTINDNLNQALTTSAWQVVYSTNVTTVSTSYNVLKTDLVVKATGSSLFTVTLPTAAATFIGQEHTIKSNMNAGIMLNVTAAGGTLIDGLSTIQLSRMESLRVISDGTQWMVV